MNTRLMIAAVTAAIGLAGSTVSIQANASCYASSFDTASSAVRANAFAQFAGGIKAAQQGRAATANVTALPNFNAPSAHALGFHVARHRIEPHVQEAADEQPGKRKDRPAALVPDRKAEDEDQIQAAQARQPRNALAARDVDPGDDGVENAGMDDDEFHRHDQREILDPVRPEALRREPGSQEHRRGDRVGQRGQESLQKPEHPAIVPQLPPAAHVNRVRGPITMHSFRPPRGHFAVQRFI